MSRARITFPRYQNQEPNTEALVFTASLADTRAGASTAARVPRGRPQSTSVIGGRAMTMGHRTGWNVRNGLPWK